MQFLKFIGVAWMVIGCGVVDEARGVLDANDAVGTLVPVSKGWAQTSVNTVIFRHNSVVTRDNTQVVSFYDPNGRVILARRQLNGRDANPWEIRPTPYHGNVKDAHCSISIMIDGDGYLHMAWGHHGSPLHYCRSVAPNSLDLTGELAMTGYKEEDVTYPEFHRLPDGNLLFIYRNGSSGRGDVMMDYYDCATQTWSLLQDSFISGEGQRNAYWQMATDSHGVIHLSWVWRESPDVATNHDLCYAKSVDSGLTWQKSNGTVYTLPITAATAEVACKINQNSELINQTSMAVDSQGHPYIATYWADPVVKRRDGPHPTDGIPQYRLVYYDGTTWQVRQISHRTTDFSLSGGGSRKIPISRPKIVIDSHDGVDRAIMIFRDIERGSRVSLALCDDLSVNDPQWRFEDLTEEGVGQWEPTYDTELWRAQKKLHIFIQRVGQGNGETTENVSPQMVYIGQWKGW